MRFLETNKNHGNIPRIPTQESFHFFREFFPKEDKISTTIQSTSYTRRHLNKFLGKSPKSTESSWLPQKIQNIEAMTRKMCSILRPSQQKEFLRLRSSPNKTCSHTRDARRGCGKKENWIAHKYKHNWHFQISGVLNGLGYGNIHTFRQSDFNRLH